ncbi:MAG: pyrroline-5-carboxylate reductase [Aquificaceae bacterium]|nr:pyrroline-5-carboxylate reductase [Aquificaceae bacterium]MDW8236880.1 pyrroline-5-carboxylate reductase [Aquificaceae bacterium]
MLGVIGFGNMGSSFVKRLHKDYKISVYDKDKSKLLNSEGLSFEAKDSLEELLEVSETLLLCVKPKDALDVLKSLSSWQGTIISCVAGLEIAKIQRFVKARVVRIMPNLAVSVGLGSIAVCGDVSEDVRRMLSRCGEVFELEEGLFDAFTAIAGSGPAFFYKFLQGMVLGGVYLGMSKESALKVSLQSILGACELLKNNGSLEELIFKVSSPGGTTIEGIKLLEEKAFCGIVLECIAKTAQKSKLLSTL